MKDKTNNPVSTDEHRQNDSSKTLPDAQELKELNEWYEKIGFFHPIDQ